MVLYIGKGGAVAAHSCFVVEECLCDTVSKRLVKLHAPRLPCGVRCRHTVVRRTHNNKLVNIVCITRVGYEVCGGNTRRAVCHHINKAVAAKCLYRVERVFDCCSDRGACLLPVVGEREERLALDIPVCKQGIDEVVVGVKYRVDDLSGVCLPGGKCFWDNKHRVVFARRLRPPQPRYLVEVGALYNGRGE